MVAFSSALFCSQGPESVPLLCPVHALVSFQKKSDGTDKVWGPLGSPNLSRYGVRARHGDKEALPKAPRAIPHPENRDPHVPPSTHPPPLCPQREQPRGRARVRCPVSCCFFVLASVSRQQRRAQSLCSSHPCPLAIHLQADPLQMPCTCSPAPQPPQQVLQPEPAQPALPALPLWADAGRAREGARRNEGGRGFTKTPPTHWMGGSLRSPSPPDLCTLQPHQHIPLKIPPSHSHAPTKSQSHTNCHHISASLIPSWDFQLLLQAPPICSSHPRQMMLEMQS